MAATPRPNLHDIKSHPEAFAALRSGRKTMELRRDDRDYQAGDYLLLREYTDTKYTGATIIAVVLSTTRRGDPWGDMAADGCVAMSILTFRKPRSI